MYITIDSLLGLTEVYQVVNKDSSHSDLTVPLNYKGKQKEIVYKKPTVLHNDPLKMELENFADSLRGNSTPAVTGMSGRNVLAIAEQIHDLILEDLH